MNENIAQANSSPYAAFNLRRNPFGELTREQRAELAVVKAQRWLEAIRHPTTALQFLGPGGNGKTTHLLAIERLLPKAAYVYLPEAGPTPPIPDQRPLLIDEAQRLRPNQRRRIFRRGGPLVLGTHEDLSKQLDRYGLQVIHINVAAEQSPERLMQILNLRIEASRITRAAVPHIDRPFAVRLQRQWGSDIRKIEHYLYDQFQDAVQKGLPWPPAS